MSRPHVRLHPFLDAACLVLVALLARVSSGFAQENDVAARDATVSLTWGDCPFDRSEIEESEGLRVRCGELAVPESWERPGGRTLGIAFTVAEPEGGATGEPVVLMPGGPGVTVVPRGLRLLRRWGVGDRTLVVFDVRGTGHSGPLMCTGLSITESDVASMDLTLEEARTLERGAYLACRDELLNRGVDLRAYRSTAVARDVRTLREALGYERCLGIDDPVLGDAVTPVEQGSVARSRPGRTAWKVGTRMTPIPFDRGALRCPVSVL